MLGYTEIKKVRHCSQQVGVFPRFDQIGEWSESTLLACMIFHTSQNLSLAAVNIQSGYDSVIESNLNAECDR